MLWWFLSYVDILILNNLPSYEDICLPIHYLMDIWLFSTSYDEYAAMHIHAHVLVWTYVFSSLRHLCRSGIARSYGSTVFNLLRN